MGHWNYRIVRKSHEGEYYYGIHEIYYDDDGNISGITQEEIAAHGDSIVDVHLSLEKMVAGSRFPIVDFDTLSIVENTPKDTKSESD